MKTVEYYVGSGCIQFCYTGLNWLVSVGDINKMADELITEERRILKAVGLHSEFIHYCAEVDLSERKIFASFDWLNVNHENAVMILNEAQRRHFKWTIGKTNDENKKEQVTK